MSFKSHLSRKLLVQRSRLYLTCAELRELKSRLLYVLLLGNRESAATDIVKIRETNRGAFRFVWCPRKVMLVATTQRRCRCLLKNSIHSTVIPTCQFHKCFRQFRESYNCVLSWLWINVNIKINIEIFCQIRKSYRRAWYMHTSSRPPYAVT
jgi:hypothetical protein